MAESTPPSLDYETRRQSGRLGHTWVGIASLIIGVCSIIALMMAMLTARRTVVVRTVVAQQTITAPGSPTTRPATVTVGSSSSVNALPVVILLLLPLSGVVLGISGIRQRYASRGLAIAGVALNGSVLLITLLCIA